MIQPISLSFTYTKKELLQVTSIMLQNKMRNVYLILLVINIITHIKDDGFHYIDFLISLILSSLVLFLMLWVARRIGYSKNKKMNTGQQVTLDDEGWEMKTDLINSKIKWQLSKKFTETKDFIVLYVMKSPTLPIPKRALTLEQLNTVREVLKQKTVKKKN
ncbi:MAG: YcxB family protein [Patescibacteria group bacterium]